MSLATLLVESDTRGGGLITARLACDYGREVFAVPGRIDQATSAGCHMLIREGASLATCAEDIADALGYSVQKVLDFSEKQEADDCAKGGDSPDSKILKALASGEALAADELAALTGLDIPQILACSMMLELKKLIVKRTDGRWEKRL